MRTRIARSLHRRRHHGFARGLERDEGYVIGVLTKIELLELAEEKTMHGRRLRRALSKPAAESAHRRQIELDGLEQAIRHHHDHVAAAELVGLVVVDEVAVDAQGRAGRLTD